MTTPPKPNSPFYEVYDLNQFRYSARKKHPEVHQTEALAKLRSWYGAGNGTGRGGILVLPTGGGKTYTAIHFTCAEAVVERTKVLWLAHTHHLLEQAYRSFVHGVGLIREPKSRLAVRLVSGMGGDHFPVHSIRPDDDVVITSLPTACRAVKESHAALHAFLESSGGDLLVVFDEAHHAPAPSYRDLLRGLRQKYPKMALLGLTATPTYGDERKAGWLLELFPQGIVYQVTANDLMARGILSRPVFHEERTQFRAEFSDRDYSMWLGTNRDLPEHIIEALARNQERNEYIVSTYANNREKWGKTLIFTDRWFQCEFIREGLIKRGVRAGVVYTHVGGSLPTADERNRNRNPNDNARVLEAFHRNELDVVINVKMLTEGTDVPDVQTVFLTRQTTSRILMTQMIGRALRGSKFGGTAEAHIVCFIDDWKQKIDWAAYDNLAAGERSEEVKVLRKQPPVHLIAVELVRRLARQMDSGSNVNGEPYLQYLPIGWYKTEYFVRVAGTDDDEKVSHNVLVLERAAANFTRFLDHLRTADLTRWKEYDVTADDAAEDLSQWNESFFGGAADTFGEDFVRRDLFAVVRHVAQAEGGRPLFIPFDAYKHHDLDFLAREHYDSRISFFEAADRLRKEYARADRMWRVFYPRFELFKNHYDGAMNRCDLLLRGELPAPISHPEATPDREPLEDVKKAIKLRDGRRCLCCGATSPLEVDHIDSAYHGGSNEPDNLQTLCKPCNKSKGTTKIDFRRTVAPAKFPPKGLTETLFPSGSAVREPEHWELYLRTVINLFYRAAAVARVEIGQRGEKFHRWRVVLHAGNNPDWLDPHIDFLARRIREARVKQRLTEAPKEIEILVEESDTDD